MARLFVIGNGFDRAHELPSDYKEDFRPLLEQSPFAHYFLELFPESKKDTWWSDFEINLYHGKYAEFLKKHHEEMDKYQISRFENRQAGGFLNDSFQQVIEKFVQKVDACALYQPKLPKIFTSTDSFVSFNYTNTLERGYSINPESNILYIHKQPDKSKKYILGYDEKLSAGDNCFEECTNFHVHYRYLLDDFQKEYQTERMIEFLKGKDTEEIIVLGHSLGEIDKKYFEELKSIFPNSSWSISYYRESDPVIKNIELYDFLSKDSLFRWVQEETSKGCETK